MQETGNQPRKLRLLALHSYESSADIFSQQVSGLLAACLSGDAAYRQQHAESFKACTGAAGRLGCSTAGPSHTGKTESPCKTGQRTCGQAEPAPAEGTIELPELNRTAAGVCQRTHASHGRGFTHHLPILFSTVFPVVGNHKG